MTHLGPSKAARLAKVFGVLKDLVASLPTAEEKQRTTESLTVLVEFLKEIQAHLDLIPTIEDTRSLTVALERLDSFLSKAEANPVLARAIGIEKPKPRPVQAVRPLPDPVRLQTIITELASFTIDQVRERLVSEDRYGLSDLRALAQKLGIRVQQRTARQALVGQIVTKLANTRGYQALSSTSDSNGPSR